MLIYVPERKRTRQVCLDSIRLNGANIRFVPDKLRTLAFDREAVMLDAWAFGYLSERDKTKELLVEAMNHSFCFDPIMLKESWAVPPWLAAEVYDLMPEKYVKIAEHWNVGVVRKNPEVRPANCEGVSEEMSQAVAWFRAAAEQESTNKL